MIGYIVIGIGIWACIEYLWTLAWMFRGGPTPPWLRRRDSEYRTQERE